MAGKLYTGAVTNNVYDPDASKAFSEGMYWRAKGISISYPSSDNPHALGSEDYVAWLAGWNVANAAAGSTIAATAAPNCAVPHNIILA